MIKTEKTTAKQKKTTTKGAKPSAKQGSGKKRNNTKRKEPTGNELFLKALKKIRETGFNDIWQR